MKKQSLYDLLSDGGWHSGQELAEHFGVSRTGIWKQIAKLRETGVEIESSQGKGYRLLASTPTLFQRDLLQSALDDQVRDSLASLQIMETVASTNDECMSWLAQAHDAKSGNATSGDALVLAEQQTAGRGRRGRAWVSPYGASIYMSMSQRFDAGAASLSGLSLVVGIAVAQAIEIFTGPESVQLKWPNDVYVAGKKLGGILLEVVGDLSGPCHTVMGIGINVVMPAGQASDIDQPFTTLNKAFPSIKWDKNLLVAEVVNKLYCLLAEFRIAGFAAFMDRWFERDMFRGQEVMVKVSEKQVALGDYIGIDEEGALILKTATGHKKFAGGEISLRAAI